MKKAGLKKAITRRKFINTASKGAAVVAGLSLLDSQMLKASVNGTNATSKVVVVTDSKILDVSNKIVKAVAQSMVDAGIIELTGITDIGNAWKSIFPGITETSKIGIKINCINSAQSSHPDVAYSITSGLMKMKFGNVSFPAENIIIWDRTNNEVRNAGYTLNNTATGIKVMGTNDSSNVVSGDGGYDATIFTVNGSSQKLSKIITQKIDFLINLNVLKNHGGGGVTLSMKNHYGTCNNPGGLHGNNCDPYIAALNALAPIKDKQKISICDAIFGVISGGPGGDPQVTPKSMIFSTDCVSMDRVGADLLLSNGMSQSSYTAAKHIATASKTPYLLGNDTPNILKSTVTNPSQTTNIEESIDSDHASIYSPYPNPFSDRVTLEFKLFKQSEVKIDVLNITGKTVKMLTNSELQEGYHQLIWDGSDAGGAMLPNGLYIVLYVINNQKFTSKIQISR